MLGGGIVLRLVSEIKDVGTKEVCVYVTRDLLTPEGALELMRLDAAQRARVFEEPVAGEAALRECAT
jgi:hypothetical protein